MSHLFYRDDCRERYDVQAHIKHPRGRQRAKVLMQRVDFRGWCLSKEFAAMVHNGDLRRRQMWGVYFHVTSRSSFLRDVDELDKLRARAILHVALAAGEGRSIREAR